MLRHFGVWFQFFVTGHKDGERSHAGNNFMFSFLECKFSNLLNSLLRTAKVKTIRAKMGKPTINLCFAKGQRIPGESPEAMRQLVVGGCKGEVTNEAGMETSSPWKALVFVSCEPLANTSVITIKSLLQFYQEKDFRCKEPASLPLPVLAERNFRFWPWQKPAYELRKVVCLLFFRKKSVAWYCS